VLKRDEKKAEHPGRRRSWFRSCGRGEAATDVRRAEKPKD
jgi:hypothetical protein